MEAFVRLRITLDGDNAPDIREVYKLYPDRVWSQGDVRPNTKIVEKSAGCILSSGLEKDASLDQHLAALLLRAKPLASIIKDLAERNAVEVLCSIYTDTVPSLYFDSSVIEGIASLGAAFDIDLYVLPEPA